MDSISTYKVELFWTIHLSPHKESRHLKIQPLLKGFFFTVHKHNLYHVSSSCQILFFFSVFIFFSISTVFDSGTGVNDGLIQPSSTIGGTTNGNTLWICNYHWFWMMFRLVLFIYLHSYKCSCIGSWSNFGSNWELLYPKRCVRNIKRS